MPAVQRRKPEKNLTRANVTGFIGYKDALESLQRLARAINGSITTAKLALENPQKVMAMQTLSSTLPFDKILEDGEVVERAMPEQMLLFAGDATNA